MSRSLCSALAAVAILVAASPARAEAPTPPAEHRALPAPDDQRYEAASPTPRPTWVWLGTQLLPSPEMALTGRAISPGARWQVTPLLYSFGLHRSVSRWRVLVVDPLARVSGSVELHATPEYVGGNVDRLLMRWGVRAYFPVLHRGEYLAVSLGTSTFFMGNRRHVSYDAGVYVLNGILGLEVSASPAYGPLAGVALLKVRYF